MPEECQSFMPHLAGVVFLGRFAWDTDTGEHFTLRNYLAANRICGFLPDHPQELMGAMESAGDCIGSIDRDAHRAEKNSNQRPSAMNLRAISPPQEYFWDLASGDLPEEIINLVVWDFGVNYGLLRSLRMIGSRLRVVPPETEPEKIIALHPDGVVIAGGPLSPRYDRYSQRIERIVGIRPVLGVGGGALLLARGMGIEIEELERAHFGSRLPVRGHTGELINTYQAHSFAPPRKGLEMSGCEVTHVNSTDESVEAFICPDYDITAAMFSMTDEKTPMVLQNFISALKREVSI